jgi:hypothetical protein
MERVHRLLQHVGIGHEIVSSPSPSPSPLSSIMSTTAAASTVSGSMVVIDEDVMSQETPPATDHLLIDTLSYRHSVIVTLNRPKALNSLTLGMPSASSSSAVQHWYSPCGVRTHCSMRVEMVEQLLALCRRLYRSHRTAPADVPRKLVIIHSCIARAFCAGGDIRQLAQHVAAYVPVDREQCQSYLLLTSMIGLHHQW